jgi:hypothetical protein
MSDLVARLLTHWRNGGAHPASGNSERAILEFEARHGVRMPDDMRYYFIEVNGMTPDWRCDQDENGFTFWPLSGVREVIRGEERTGLFTFADYLSSSWEYSIKLVGSPDYAAVFLVDPEISPVASSFSEFLSEYLIDSPRIYRHVAGAE